MTGSLWHLALAVFLFAATHIALPMTGLRRVLVARIGRWGYLGVYSVVAMAFLAWSIQAYAAAPDVELFTPNTAMRHASLTIMVFACYLVVGGYTTASATMMGMQKTGMERGPRGVLRITRHPVMWGVTLWGISHVIANGTAAAAVFFGAMAVVALAGAAHIDRRRQAELGDAWKDYAAQTSFIPLAAILAGRAKVEKGEVRWWQTGSALILYAVLLALHGPVIGIDVMPF